MTDLEDADLHLSRSPGRPRGQRAAGARRPGLPDGLLDLNGRPIVGLTLSPDRLLQIRRNRLRSLNEDRESAYVDTDAVRAEIVAARRLFEARAGR